MKGEWEEEVEIEYRQVWKSFAEKRSWKMRLKGEVESRGLLFFAFKKVKLTADKDNRIARFQTDGDESAERENVLRERKIVMGKGR